MAAISNRPEPWFSSVSAKYSDLILEGEFYETSK